MSKHNSKTTTPARLFTRDHAAAKRLAARERLTVAAIVKRWREAWEQQRKDGGK